MIRAKSLLGALLTGVAVALVYAAFTFATHTAIELLWFRFFDGSNALVLLALTLLVSLLFFAAIRRGSVIPRQSHDNPEPTFGNLGKVLGSGFLSLLSGASLGPEAILIPASSITGGLVSRRLRIQKTEVFAIVGFSALFVAFFHSFIFMLLGLALARKRFNEKFTKWILIMAAVGSLATYMVLRLLHEPAYIAFPPTVLRVSFVAVLALAALFAAGYAANIGLRYLTKRFDRFYLQARPNWWQHAFIAAVVLSTLYIGGGEWVRFTGNDSILPLFNNAPHLGLGLLLWIMGIKIVAIAWSRSSSYRGGLIFPMVFVASTMVAIAQRYAPGFGYGFELAVVLLGMFTADRKTKLLV